MLRVTLLFGALVISAFAATSATVGRQRFSGHGSVTVVKCMKAIKARNLLHDTGPYALEWEIAKYNLGFIL
ncbi:hypothetical protein F4779DRAFT_558776 [Xylariaceae sp. FL0662B]|nr:hypothetical protein F4779DRAFT_558776 [Xylariaceae sp. FL0662B]